MRVSYSDGDEIEAHLLDLVSRTNDLSSLSLIASEEYSNWPVRYHLCPERANLLRHLDFTGLDVLELGAGMGGASRYIAENAASFLAVEAMPRRLEVLRKRLRDLKNWDSAVSNIEDFESDRRFDVVCLVGVLEYAELFFESKSDSSPFARMIAKASSFLKPGGTLVLAIENRNGIKYWAGAPEDHTGQMFDGICGYSATKSPRTFSRAELIQLLRECKLPSVEEFFPWPDYKTPHAVVSKQFVDRYPDLAADLSSDAVMREPIQGVHYFPTTLAIYETVPSGLYCDMANSFLFVAGADGQSETSDRLLGRMRNGNEFAWHYSLIRKLPIRTFFRAEPGDESQPIVHKEVLSVRDESKGKLIGWKKEAPIAALSGAKLSHLLRRIAYFTGREEFERELFRYIEWSIDMLAEDAEHLRPIAFDAIALNAVVVPDGYCMFDLEWELAEPMRKSWFVLRNVANLVKVLNLFKKPEYANGAELYMILCERLNITPDLDGDLWKEAEAQFEICNRLSLEGLFHGLEIRMKTAINSSAFPRDSESEKFLRRDLADNPDSYEVVRALQMDNQHLRDQMSRTCVRIGLALDARLRRVRPLFEFVRKSYSFGARLRRR